MDDQNVPSGGEASKPVDLGLGADAVVSTPPMVEQELPPPLTPEASQPQDLVPPVVVVPEESKTRKSLSIVLSVLPLIVGPMILAVSLAYSFNRANSASGEVDITSKAAPEINEATVKVTDSVKITPEIAAKWRTILSSVPKNPDSVVATASKSGKMVTLFSGQPYDYPEVTFTWSGDRAVEQGAKIIGYYVYFGPKYKEIPFPTNGNGESVWPSIDGVLVKSNSYTVSNLAKGTRYYLYVQSISDSTVPYHNLGMEEVAPYQTLQAKKLFTYIYQ